MPWSYGDDVKRKALALLSARTGIRGVLDLGAGAGLWRTFSREFVVGSVPWTAVEAHAPYIARFDLGGRYDAVRHKDLRLIKYGHFPGHVFIFGDVLEHLERAQAIDVMRRAGSMGTVVAMMPFLPTASEEQDAVDGVEWERHRYVWQWQEWLNVLADLGHQVEVVQAPAGDERNKGCTISWHAAHPLWDYWQGRSHLAYYRLVHDLVEQASPGRAILDVGCWDTPVATWGDFERRYTCDLAVDPHLPGVSSHVGDFLTWDVPERMSVATCLQTVEHLRDENVRAFGAKLLDSADTVIVSVPHRWPAGREWSHQQDPIDLDKLIAIMGGRAPALHQVVRDGKSERLVALWN